MAYLQSLSDCELMVMTCIWDYGRAMSVNELVQDVERKYNKVYNRTTIYTFLRRLYEKGYVTSVKHGRSYFSPKISKQSYLTDCANRIADLFLGESSMVFLASFYKNGNYSAEEWHNLAK